ncbi:MAG TPA: efflux RND transporter periplasmic adaptor subunit [Burkholderiales bacterium]|nr:efflux RND transporter periplasmic adaptor subunit [Burkholderiales bacterium]
MKQTIGKAFLLVLLVMMLLAAAGILERKHHLDLLKQQAKENSIQQVIVFSPHAESGLSALDLPGDIRGYRDTAIYARSPGYLKEWDVDIGTEVKKGDLIARIETPEVDQEVRQARADLATAKANYDLAKSTAERWQNLAKTRTVSRQDLENKLGDEKAKKAVLDSADAHLGQLLALNAFEEVRAPFSGTVSARNIDVGDLVTAAPSGQELFHMVDSRKLRIYVQVPQAQANEIRVGMKAAISVPEYPGRRFDASVIRNAGALDPESRTVLVELLFDNSGHSLKAGDYASVSFETKSSGRTVMPITALIFRGEGLQVATVRNSRVHLVKVMPGRDFGKSMEVLSGLDEHSIVIDNPPDSIMEGQPVAVASVRSFKADK